MQRMLSTSDFAAAIGISESSVRRLADSGDLEIHRTRGGHRRIPVSEAIRYVRETAHVSCDPMFWVWSHWMTDPPINLTQIGFWMH